MKFSFIFTTFLFFIGCSTNPAETTSEAGNQIQVVPTVEGQWELVEIKCENSDYTNAGTELRKFYQNPGVKRTATITGDKIYTKITVSEDKKTKTKACLTEIFSNVEFQGDTMINHSSTIKKSSATDKKCQGERKITDKTSGQFAVDKDALKTINKGPLKRLNPKDSEIVCKESALISVYRRL